MDDFLDTTTYGSRLPEVREIQDEMDTLVPDNDTRECGENTTPIDKPAKQTPMIPTLAQQHSKAEAEVEALRAKIANCPHEWVEEAARMETHALDLGESIGTSNIWVLRQHRDCSRCGLHQAQTKYEPNWEWSDWE